ncbi:unnamed protein product [Cyprideis torosa]|uniref:Uncharacterized protein n=1 Tax=Cyprideis torosa TaxID=163714 RepID=A0A7R8W958_9CRUS|nr:unnamed protein product [Cyprideis torosa]CAG0888188.1 unnamed protein product [Cyprideis torosa]
MKDVPFKPIWYQKSLEYLLSNVPEQEVIEWEDVTAFFIQALDYAHECSNAARISRSVAVQAFDDNDTLHLADLLKKEIEEETDDVVGGSVDQILQKRQQELKGSLVEVSVCIGPKLDTTSVDSSWDNVKRIYTCEFCGKVFTRSSSKARHKKHFHTGKGQRAKVRSKSSTKCEICGDCDVCIHNVEKRKGKSEENVGSGSSEKENVETTATDSGIGQDEDTQELLDSGGVSRNRRQVERSSCCEICGKTFLYSSSKARHKKFVHLLPGSRPNKVSKKTCEVCGAVLSSAHSLRIHMKYRHTDLSVCSVCGERVPTLELMEHVQSHEGQEPTKCDECQETFYSRRKLYIHVQRTHRPENWVVCDICGKTEWKGNLAVHRQSHRVRDPKDAKYPCDQCEKKFFLQRDVERHVRRMHQPRSLVCSICAKPFYVPWKLREHENMHKGVKPHKCQLCGKAYSRKPALRKHEMVHANNRRHQCKLCSKSFFEIEHLKEHMNSHTGARPFVCNICGVSYPARASLYNHVKFKHKSTNQIGSSLGVEPIQIDDVVGQQ